MKLRLPKALMTAMAAVAVAAAPLATTVATGMLFAVNTVQAEITYGTTTIDGNTYNTVNFSEGDTLGTKPTFSENGGNLGYLQINISATETEGDVATYAAGAQVTTPGHAEVNIGEGANVVFGLGTARYDMFTGSTVDTKVTTLQDAGTQTINLGRDATMTSNCSFAGWSDGSDNGFCGTTVINMSAGSVWNVAPSIHDNCEYLNRTTIVMDGAVINIANGKSMQSEHGSNATNIFRTAATATTQSIIQSVNTDGTAGTGKIYFQNHGVTFDVANTLADGVAGLRVDANIGGVAGKDAWKKTGIGILELTYCNGNSSALTVEEGTVRVSGTDGRTGTGSVTLGTSGNGATLELLHTGATEAAPVVTTNAITFANAGSVLSVKGAYEKTTGAISGAGTISVAAGAHYTATGAITNASLSVAGSATIGAISGNGSISVANGGALSIGGSYALAQGNIATTGTGSVAFGESASINVADWTAAASKDTSTYTGFLTDSYTFFTNGANVSLADGGITLMNGATNLGKATLTVSEGTGTLELGKYVYNIASGTVNYSTIRGEADNLLRVQVQSGGTLSIDGTPNNQKLNPALCTVTGNGTVELAWTGRVSDNETFNNGLNSFDGDVVVKSGASVILAGSQHSFHSLTAEAGGQLAINRAYTGDVTIAGTGLAAAGNDTCGALKLGSGITLTGNVTLKGDSVAISMWGSEAGTIAGNINGENAHTDLHFWNGNNTGDNSLTVRGTISKVDYIEVHRGNLIANSIDLSGEDSFVKAGAGALTLKSATDEFFNKATISDGKVVLEGATLTDSGTGKITYTGTNTNSGYCTGVNGSGDSLGGQDLVMKGTVNYAGEFVVAAGTLALGDANGNAKSTISINQLTIQDGARVRLQGQGTNAENTNIKLAGGSLYLHDSNNFANTYSFGQLDVANNSTMEIAWKGAMVFDCLTGEADLTISNIKTDTRTVEFKNIVNYNGTVTNNMVGTYKIGHVDQAAGNAATFNGSCAITSADFQKSGEGSINLSSLTINANGTLYMTYEGGLTIGEDFAGLHVGNNSTLKYDNAPNLITLGSGSLTGVTGLTVNIDKATGKSLVNGGYNLGIAEGYTGTISVSGMTADTDYTLAAKDGYWHLTLAKADALIWDTNWGVAEIMTAPAVTEAAPTANENSLSGAATKLTGTGGNNVIVIGGAANAPSGTAAEPQDTWIYAQAGKYKALVGGNYANNWNYGTRADFNGDTHILVDGATVGTIIGGNWKDGKGPQRTGDTYISIMDGSTVERSIIGVDLLTHNASPQQTGNVNIFIYTSLGTVTNDITAMHNESAYMVVGGFVWGTNSSNTPTLTGDTNITVDLTNATNKGTAFGKYLIGGNANGSSNGTHVLTGNTHVNVNLDGGSMGNGMKVIGGSWTQGNTSTHNGDTNVTIDGAGTYNGPVVAGSWLLSGTANIQGNTNMTITNGTFAQNVVGSTALSGGTSTHDNGGTNVTITGGTFNNMVIAGNDVTGGTANLRGDTHLTITGGTFSAMVLGGSRTSDNYTANVTGTTHIDISGGTFGNDAWVIGGSYHHTNGVTQTVGGVEMNLTGGTFNGLVIGGNRLNGSGSTSFNKFEMGDIHVTVDGATINNKLYGGGYTVRNVADKTLVQGNITLDLKSGTLAGDVYAAGYQSGSTKLSAESVTVNVSSGITFSGTRTVNGGYETTGNNNTSTVTGSRTLEFADTAYTNLSGVTFTNFSTVDITNEAESVSLNAFKYTGDAVVKVTNSGTNATVGTLTSSGSLTKNGEGTLTITSHAVTGRIISNEGEVVINGGNEIAGIGGSSKVTISGISNVNGDNSAFTGELQLNGNTVVKFANGNSVGGANSKLIATDGSNFWIGDGSAVSTDIVVKGSATLNGSQSVDYSFSGALTGESGSTYTVYTGRNVTMSGDLSDFHGTINIGNDRGTNLHISSAFANDATVSHIGSTTDNTGTLTFDNTAAMAFGSKVQNVLNVVQAGSGETTFSNTDSTYTGSTSVTDGTLKVTGNIKNTSSVAVSGNGVLEVSGADASVTAGGTNLTAQGATGTVKNITTLDGTHLTGATSGEGADIKALGEMTSLTLAAAASMDVSNVTMKQSTIAAGDNTITYSNVTAVATADKPQTRAAGPAISTADGSATLTEIGTTVQTGGTATGTLTVDIAYALLNSHRGGSVTWTIFDNVDITDAHLQLGDVLTTIVNNGLPVVQLKIDDEAAQTITAANLQVVDNQPYDLLAGYTGSHVVVLTVENIPEPATGVLSVLALAGLAARRRREKKN